MGRKSHSETDWLRGVVTSCRHSTSLLLPSIHKYTCHYAWLLGRIWYTWLKKVVIVEEELGLSLLRNRWDWEIYSRYANQSDWPCVSLDGFTPSFRLLNISVYKYLNSKLCLWIWTHWWCWENGETGGVEETEKLSGTGGLTASVLHSSGIRQFRQSHSPGIRLFRQNLTVVDLDYLDRASQS